MAVRQRGHLRDSLRQPRCWLTSHMPPRPRLVTQAGFEPATSCSAGWVEANDLGHFRAHPERPINMADSVVGQSDRKPIAIDVDRRDPCQRRDRWPSRRSLRLSLSQSHDARWRVVGVPVQLDFSGILPAVIPVVLVEYVVDSERKHRSNEPQKCVGCEPRVRVPTKGHQTIAGSFMLELNPLAPRGLTKPPPRLPDPSLHQPAGARRTPDRAYRHRRGWFPIWRSYLQGEALPRW